MTRLAFIFYVCLFSKIMYETLLSYTFNSGITFKGHSVLLAQFTV